MAADLKSFFNHTVIASLASDLTRVCPTFAEQEFIADCLNGLDALELLDRARHIARAMHRHLPADFERSASILVRSLNDPTGFQYLPHTIYVAEHGLEHFEASMAAQYELTKRFTAEWSIRHFLVRHPEATLERLRLWAADPNEHVRRLVSEGTRPRLPWAMRLREFQRDPSPTLELLELLKDDASLYVRRSVANHLNDIAKDHPKLAIEVCKRWSTNATPERRWIVRHALRTLVKKGDPAALALLGVGGVPRVEISKIRFTPKQTRIGGAIAFSFQLTSTARKTQTLLVDFQVHFRKANGKSSPKVFKLTRLTLDSSSSATLSAKVSFAQMTTRKHYPGPHAMELLINGRVLPLGTVKVLPA